MADKELTQTDRLFKGKKLQMSQVFTTEGKVIPVTRIKVVDEPLNALSADLEDTQIEIVGKSKGKGFTGVMKKWNFKGAQATRGQSDKPRSGGSIGAQTPSRVFKGKKMAGRHGNKRVTLKGARIIKVDTTTSELLVSGPVPGARNSDVLIKFSK